MRPSESQEGEGKKWIYPIIQQATTAPAGRWGSLAFCHKRKPKESCSLLRQPYGNEALSCSMVKAALTAALLYSLSRSATHRQEESGVCGLIEPTEESG